MWVPASLERICDGRTWPSESSTETLEVGSGQLHADGDESGALPCERIEDEDGNTLSAAGVNARGNGLQCGRAEISLVAQRTWS